MRFAGFLLATASLCLEGQSAPIFLGGGYSAPGGLLVAPGQVVSLFVKTSSTPIDGTVSVTANTWPTTLAGFSVTLNQSLAIVPVPVPIQSVFPIANCPPVQGVKCTEMVGLTVQIPYELIPNIRLARMPANFASLTIRENDGAVADSLPLNPVSEQLHILASCDLTLLAPVGLCQPLVRHADGSLVSALNPAHAGDTLTVSAYGLGQTDAQLNTGTVPLTDTPVTEVLAAFQPVSIGITNSNLSAVPASASSLGVGVYSVQVTVPQLENLPACEFDGHENVIIAIQRGDSAATAPICVR